MIMRVRLRFVFLVSALVSSSLLPVHSQQAANIVVRAGEVLGPVNHLIFGQNIEAGDNADIFSSDTTDMNLIRRGEGAWDSDKRAPVSEVVNQSKAVNMSLLRYPGGCL